MTTDQLIDSQWTIDKFSLGTHLDSVDEADSDIAIINIQL